jgi:hypothetical protein
MADRTGGMGARASETKKNVDNAMKIIEEKMLAKASVNLEALRPQFSDKESFDKLIEVINNTTQQNTLRQRISVLGEGVMNAAIKLASCLR